MYLVFFCFSILTVFVLLNFVFFVLGGWYVLIDVLLSPLKGPHPTEISPLQGNLNPFLLHANWDQAVNWTNKCPSFTVHDLDLTNSAICARHRSNDPNLSPFTPSRFVIDFYGQIAILEVSNAAQPLCSWRQFWDDLLLET